MERALTTPTSWSLATELPPAFSRMKVDCDAAAVMAAREGQMGNVVGKVVVTNLPPRRGVIVSLAFFRVPDAGSPAPHGGEPTSEQVTDEAQLLNDVHLEREKTDASVEQEFDVDRPAGFYYLQVRVILFRAQAGKTFAQAEQFFFGKRPLPVPCEGVTLPVAWPDLPLDDLHHHGTVRPAK